MGSPSPVPPDSRVVTAFELAELLEGVGGDRVARHPDPAVLHLILTYTLRVLPFQARTRDVAALGELGRVGHQVEHDLAQAQAALPRTCGRVWSP